MPKGWNDSMVISIINESDQINYRSISLLPAYYKISSNILLLRLEIFAEAIIKDYIDVNSGVPAQQVN